MAAITLSVNCSTSVNVSADNKIFDGANVLMDGSSHLVDGSDTRISLDIINLLSVDCSQHTYTDNTILPTVINLSPDCSSVTFSGPVTLSTIDSINLSVSTNTVLTTPLSTVQVLRNLSPSCTINSTAFDFSISQLVFIQSLCGVFTTVSADNKILDGTHALMDGSSFLVDGPGTGISLDINNSLFSSCRFFTDTREIAVINNASLSANCVTSTTTPNIKIATGGDTWELAATPKIYTDTDNAVSSIFTFIEVTSQSLVSTSPAGLSVDRQIVANCKAAFSTSDAILNGSVPLSVSCSIQTIPDTFNVDIISNISADCSLTVSGSSLDIVKCNFINAFNSINTATGAPAVEVSNDISAISHISTAVFSPAINTINRLSVSSSSIATVKKPVLNISGEIEIGVSCDVSAKASMPTLAVIGVHHITANCSVVSLDQDIDLEITTAIFTSCISGTLTFTCDIHTVSNLHGTFGVSTDTSNITGSIYTSVHADCQLVTDVSFPEYNVLRLFNAACEVIADIDSWYLVVQGALVYLHAESNINCATSTPTYGTMPFPDIEDCFLHIYQDALAIEDCSLDLMMIDVSSKLTLNNTYIN